MQDHQSSKWGQNMNASDDMTTTTNHHSVNHDFRRICSSKHDQATTRERKQRQLF